MNVQSNLFIIQRDGERPLSVYYPTFSYLHGRIEAYSSVSRPRGNAQFCPPEYPSGRRKNSFEPHPIDCNLECVYQVSPNPSPLQSLFAGKMTKAN